MEYLEPWLKNERYVAFLDILGFSEVVRKVDQYKLTEIVEGLQSTINLSTAGFENSRLEATMLSDTILVWTHDDTALSLQHLVSAVGTLILNIFSFDRLSLRGAITVGKAQIFDAQQESTALNWNKMLLGKAVIEAHDLEKSQNWSGCILSNEALERARQKNQNAFYEMPEWEESNLTKWDVPLKTGITSHYVLINWIRVFFYGDNPLTNQISDDEILEPFTSYSRNLPDDGKYDNTIILIRHVEDTFYKR